MVVARLPGPAGDALCEPGGSSERDLPTRLEPTMPVPDDAIPAFEPLGPRLVALDPVTELAHRWAGQLPADAAPPTRRLRTLLRRLSAALRAEPFRTPAARRAGAAFYRCGPGTRPIGAGPAPEDLLPPTLGLLRSDAQEMIGTPGSGGTRHLAAALDQFAAGYLGALRERAETERQDLLVASRWPADDLRLALADGDLHYRTLYLQGPVGIGIGNLTGDLLEINPVLYRLFGVDRPPQLPRPIADFVHPDDAAVFGESYRRLCAGAGPDTVVVDTRLVRPDGLVLWTRVTGSLVRDADGGPSRVIAVVQDVSERQRLRSRLERASTHDRLTRLPNRAVTEHRLRQAFVPGTAARVGLCAVDVDGFGAFNDSLGHQAGDQLLLAVASRLQMAAGDHLVTRTGGDEFAVLAVGTAGLQDACRLADRLIAALESPFHVEGRTLSVTASIGVAEAPTATTVPEELRRSADVAMSWAKSRGGARRVVFDPERDAGEAARFALLAGLPNAVANDELRLAFQPLVHLGHRRLRGVEALVRWQHPTEGLIGPGRFIALAERSGAIVTLGHWVLAEACRTAAGWHAELGADCPYVSVNVSPLQLTEPGWVDEVTGVLADTGLPPGKLQLEITEQAVLGDEAIALDALGALRAEGVRLALDDFGTGYSSLAWLRMLPVHALKIDGSFIDGLRHPDPDPVDESIVRALVEMAHALGLEVTAEWVETGVQAERLARLGCDLGQGRWFGDAGPAEWVRDLARRTIG